MILLSAEAVNVILDTLVKGGFYVGINVACLCTLNVLIMPHPWNEICVERLEVHCSPKV